LLRENSTQRRSSLTPSLQTQDSSRSIEDGAPIKLSEKNRMINERMKHRSLYSSFAKTTQVVTKKRKKETDYHADKYYEHIGGNKMKKTKLTTETKTETFVQKATSFKNKDFKFKALKVVEEQKEVISNELKVPIIPPAFHEWYLIII